MAVGLNNLPMVQVGQVFYNVIVSGHGAQGDPIVKLFNGLVAIIKNSKAKKGDEIDIEITHSFEKFLFAREYK